MSMTNAEVIIRAMAGLGGGFHSTRELALQSRKEGFLMEVSTARMTARALARRGVLEEIKSNDGRYWFGAVGAV